MAKLPDEFSVARPERSVNTGVASYSGATGEEGRSAQFLSAGATQMGEANQYLLKIKSEADDIAAQDAANKLNEERLKQTFDPQTGVINQKGADAATPEFVPSQLERFQKSVDAIKSTLKDPRQVMLFDRHAETIMRQHTGTIYEHASKETFQHRVDVLSTTVEQAKQAASQYTDPGPSVQADIYRNHVETELLNGYMAIDKLVQVMGKTEPGFAEQEKVKLRDEIYGNRILRVSVDDPVKAEAMFNDLLSRDQSALSPKAKLSIKSHLKTGVDDQLTRKGGMDVVNEVVNKAMAPGLPQIGNVPKDDVAAIIKSIELDKAKGKLPDGYADINITLDGKNTKGRVVFDSTGVPVFIPEDVLQLQSKVGVLPAVNSKVDYALLQKPIEERARAWAQGVRPGDAAFADRTVANAKTHLNSLEAQQQATQRKAWETTEQALFGIGNPNPPSTVPELKAAVGPGVLESLPAGSLHGVMVGLEANEKRRTGGTLKLDGKTYTDLLSKIWRGELKEDWELASYVGRGLDPAHLNQLRNEVNLAQNGSVVVQDRVKKTFGMLDNVWKVQPGMQMPQYQGMIESQKVQWLEGLRSELQGVPTGTPQEREAKQLEIINKWSSPEKIKEYQPDIVEGLKADRTRISEIQRAAPSAIPIMSKDPLEMRKLYNEAAPGQQLIVWDMYERDGKTKKTKPEWAVITKPAAGEAKVTGEGVRVTPADKIRAARQVQSERVQGSE